MPHWIFIAVILLSAIAFTVIAIPEAKESKRRLSQFWSRRCTGKEWRRHFPDASKEEIRGFLELFVDGFAFKCIQRLKFSPNDKVYEIYRALYPSLGGGDLFELETFSLNLQEAYGIDVSRIPNGDLITLGELFQMTIIPTGSSS